MTCGRYSDKSLNYAPRRCFKISKPGTVVHCGAKDYTYKGVATKDYWCNGCDFKTNPNAVQMICADEEDSSNTIKPSHDPGSPKVHYAHYLWMRYTPAA